MRSTQLETSVRFSSKRRVSVYRLLRNPVVQFFLAIVFSLGLILVVVPRYGFAVALSLVFSVFILFLFFARTKESILLLFFLRFTLDMLWNVNVAPEFGIRNPLFIVGAFVPLFCLVYLLVKKVNFFGTRISKILLFYFFTQAMSFMVFPLWQLASGRSNVFFLNLENLIRFTNFLPIFFIVPLLFTTKKGIANVLNAWLFGSIIPIVVTMYLTATGARGAVVYKWGVARMYGPFYDPANLGIISLIVIAIILFKFQTEKSIGLARVPYLIWLAALTYIFYQSMSRTTWIGCFLMIALWFAFKKDWRKLLLFGIIIVVLYFSLAGIRYAFRQETAIFDPDQNILYTMDMRPRTWIDYIEIFKNYSFSQKMLGYGPSIPLNPHNQVLYYLLATGIVGMLGYLVLTIGVAVALFRRLRIEQSNYGSHLVAMALGLWIANFVMGISFQTLAWVNLQWFLWALLGIAMKRIYRVERKEKKGLGKP